MTGQMSRDWNQGLGGYAKMEGSNTAVEPSIFICIARFFPTEHHIIKIPILMQGRTGGMY